MGGVGVQQMPYLNHLTLCLWTKMPQTSVTGFRHNVLVNYFEQSTRKGFSLYFTHWDGVESSVPPLGGFSYLNPDRYVTSSSAEVQTFVFVTEIAVPGERRRPSRSLVPTLTLLSGFSPLE